MAWIWGALILIIVFISLEEGINFFLKKYFYGGKERTWKKPSFISRGIEWIKTKFRNEATID